MNEGLERRILFASSSTMAQASYAITLLEERFASAGLKISAHSDLGRAVTVGRKIASGDFRFENSQDLVRAMVIGQTLDRVAWAVSALDGEVDAKSHLWPLRKDTIGPGSRGPSRAKDKLWELELLRMLLDRGISARLAEPDVMATVGGREIGFACKRIYSIDNMKAQASDGMRQLLPTPGSRVLALSFDELLPPWAVIDAATPADGTSFLDEHNQLCLSKAERQLASYMREHRLSGVFAASTNAMRVPAFIGNISTATQFTIWVHPEASQEERQHLSELESAIEQCSYGSWRQHLDAT